MITVINATNRPDNRTQLFSKLYYSLLQEKGIKSQYLTLEDLNDINITNYLDLKNNEKLQQIYSNFIEKADKLVFVTPEYNGSYTGILKLFIDASNMSLYENKKIALVGTSTGRAGNVRGMDHLTNIFNYLQAHVLHFKVPISSVNQFIQNEKVTDTEIKDLFNKQISLFLEF